MRYFDYHTDVYWLFSYLSRKYLKNTTANADLYVFLTDHSGGNEYYGGNGISWRGTLCGHKRSRMSISAYVHSDIYTVEVRRDLDLTQRLDFVF